MTLQRARAMRVALGLAVAVSVGASTVGAVPVPKTSHPRPAAPTKAAIDEGRALYVAGNRAVDEGRWADALRHFERSYALSGVAAALFNVATSLRALGRHVEARDAFAQLLDDHRQAEPRIKGMAEAMLGEERARVAVVTLVDLPRDLEIALVVDGSSAHDDGSRPLSLELDPGPHRLRVESSRSSPPRSFALEFSLVDGERREVTVTLRGQGGVAGAASATTGPLASTPPAAPIAPIAPAATSASQAPSPEPRGGLLSSPIFWGVVGVVVVGAAVGGGYWWHQSRQLEPASPTVVKL